MKVLKIIGLIFLVKVLSQVQARNAPATPGDVVQEIRDENAAFWASVGSPFDVRNGRRVAADPYIEGISQRPFSSSDVNIGGGFVT